MADKKEKPDKFAKFKKFRDAGITDSQLVKFSNLAEQLIAKKIPIIDGESLTDYKERVKFPVKFKTDGILMDALGQIARNRQVGIRTPTPEPFELKFPAIVPAIVSALRPSQSLANRIPLIPGPFPPSTQAGIQVGVPPPLGGLPIGRTTQPIPAGGVAPPLPGAGFQLGGSGNVGEPGGPETGGSFPPLAITPDQGGPVLPNLTAPPPALTLPNLDDLAAQPPRDPAGLPAGLPPLPGLDVPRTTATPTARKMRNILVPEATPQEAADLDDVLTEIEGGDLDLFDVGDTLPPGLPPLP